MTQVSAGQSRIEHVLAVLTNVCPVLDQFVAQRWLDKWTADYPFSITRRDA